MWVHTLRRAVLGHPVGKTGYPECWLKQMIVQVTTMAEGDLVKATPHLVCLFSGKQGLLEMRRNTLGQSWLFKRDLKQNSG